MTGKTVKNTERVRRAVSAHGLLGVAISAVLYVVCLSGTVSVFKDELQHLEQRTAIPTVSTLDGAALMRAARLAMGLEPDSDHLLIYPPTADTQSAIVSTDNLAHYITSDGELAVAKHHPWSTFLIDLHYYLNMPENFGMLVVASFGVMLFGMSLTGLLAHPNIFKDAFSMRKGKSPRLLQTDLHNRLGVWTMPFHLSNSLTGAMIGLASLSALAVATLNYEGDTAAVFAPVFGSEPAVDERAASMSRMDLAMAHVHREFPQVQPVLLVLHDPLTQGQYLQIFGEHHDRLIFAEKYNYDGNGQFLGTVGSLDGLIGQQVADSVYKIHFGSFGGLTIKIIYAFFGVCLLYIIHAGMRVYFIKRAARAGFYAAWLGVAVGSPGLLAISFGMSSLFNLSPQQLQWMFWLGLGVCILASQMGSQRLSAKARIADRPITVS